MTPLQKLRVEEMRKAFLEMQKRYLAFGETRFVVMVNKKNEEDKYVTVMQDGVSGTDIDNQPFYDLSITLIQPDGATIDMMKRMHPDDVNRYLAELTVIQ